MTKQIFGVLKHKFWILLITPKYSLEIQACIPATLVIVHNFICYHEPGEDKIINNEEPIGGMVENDDDDAEWTDGGVGEQDARRDSIASAMWEQYKSEHVNWGSSPWWNIVRRVNDFGLIFKYTVIFLICYRQI